MTPEQERKIWEESDRVFAKAEETFEEMDKLFKTAPEGETILRKQDGVIRRVLRIFKRS